MHPILMGVFTTDGPEQNREGNLHCFVVSQSSGSLSGALSLHHRSSSLSRAGFLPSRILPLERGQLGTVHLFLKRNVHFLMNPLPRIFTF